MTIPLILQYVVARLSGLDKEITGRVGRSVSCLSDSPFDILRQAASEKLYLCVRVRQACRSLRASSSL